MAYDEGTSVTVVIRRLLLCGLASALCSLGIATHAQTFSRMPRVAFLGMDSRMQGANLAGFVNRMHALGYVEGRNVVIDYRWAEGQFERLPALAAELVALNPDVIVTMAPPSIRAVQKATTTIPVVMVVHDPVGMGFASSLNHPGGNITGVAFQDSEFSTKRMDVLRQLLPGLSRIAVIWNREGSGSDALHALETAAKSIGVELLILEVKQRADFAAVVASAKSWNADGIVQLSSPFITSNRAALLEAVARARLPMMCELRMYVVDGCLMTYSASLLSMYGHLADYVDRILRGAKPADLPIDQPREFEFVINERTAEALGLAIPQSLRFQATEVIR